VSEAGAGTSDVALPVGRLRRIATTTFSSLRVRNYRLFFFGQLISNSGNWLTNVALTLLILNRTDSGIAVGLLTTCQYGPILLFSVYGGTIADRIDKRKMLFVTQAGEMAQSILLAYFAFVASSPLAAFYVTAFLGGMLLAFDNPARRSFVTEMVPDEELSNAVVLYSTIVNVSRILGPTLAGVLVVTVGYGWCFTIDAASYVFVIAALWMMRPAELRRLPPRPRRKGEIRAAVRYVASSTNLRVAFVMLGAVGLLAYNFSVTLPLLVTRSLDGTDGQFTLIYACFSAGAVVSALVVANRHLVHVRHVIVGSIALAVAMALLSAVPNVATAIPVAFLVGLSSILYMTSTTSIVQVEANPAMHGRILALQTVLLVGTAPIGGPLLGWLADVYGARAPMVIGAVACLGAALYGIAASHRTAPGATPPAAPSSAAQREVGESWTEGAHLA
jgi:MFS family permease